MPILEFVQIADSSLPSCRSVATSRLRSQPYIKRDGLFFAEKGVALMRLDPLTLYKNPCFSSNP